MNLPRKCEELKAFLNLGGLCVSGGMSSLAVFDPSVKGDSVDAATLTVQHVQSPPDSQTGWPDHVRIYPSAFFGTRLGRARNVVELHVPNSALIFGRRSEKFPDLPLLPAKKVYPLLSAQNKRSLTWIAGYMEVDRLLGAEVCVCWSFILEGVMLVGADTEQTVAGTVCMLNHLQRWFLRDPDLETPSHEEIVAQIISYLEE